MLVRALDAIKPNPLLLPFMLDGYGVAIHDGDDFVLPGFGLATAKEAGKKNGENGDPSGFSHPG